jgi:hypothetical protein
MFDPLEFGFSLVCNNRLAAERVSRGGALELCEIIELMARSQSLFDLATLCARDMTKVRNRQELWASMRDLYDELDRAWDDVPRDGELANAYLSQLRRLQELCADYANIYVIPARERLKHSRRRGASVETTQQRGHQEPEPDGWRDQGTVGHVYSVHVPSH